MRNASAPQTAAFGRMLAAYKLRLARKAEELGTAKPETWGHNNPISREEEQRKLSEQDSFRISPFPYPGLRSFEPEEGELFFGRDRNVEEVRLRLARSRIVVVLGGSGSGKSSLVRAGLLPFLNTERRIKGRDGNWYWTEFRPRTDPIGELADALADQLFRPLLALNKPGLPEAMGLPPIQDAQIVRASLRGSMRQRFAKARHNGREAVRALLLDIADRQLDTLDRLATQGRRVPGPSLLLLLDQFEEVFRPEVAAGEREALLDLIVDIHTHMERQFESEKGGLFLAITMRSEEMHRCAEHRGLSEVVIGSGYQLELLDSSNKEDREDLRKAILEPARNVFEDWGLDYDRSNPDAPFAHGMPALLLDGAARLPDELDHRPDQLPLLQHSLQASWHAAMRRWSSPGFRQARFEITLADMPGQDPDSGVLDLGACFEARANKAADRAAKRFAHIARVDEQVGHAAIQAAFRALARRDDRGNWTRRFGNRAEINNFLAADPEIAGSGLSEDVRWDATRHALHVFLLRGYLNGGGNRDYDISHEALIRNWPRFQLWLRDPEEVVYALGRVMIEVRPFELKEQNDDEKARQIPEDVAKWVAKVSSGGGLPVAWGEDQIAPILLKPAMRKRWGADKAAALKEILQLSSDAERARRRERQWKIGRRGAAALFLVIAGSAFIYERQVAAARTAAAEAQAEAAEARQEAATADARAFAAVARQLGANSVIGSIVSEGNLGWAPGTRERAAIHALEMLVRDGGELPPLDAVRPMTSVNWNTGVRTLLGRRFNVTGFESPPPQDKRPACVDIGVKDSGSAAQSEAELGFLSEQDRTLVRLVPPADWPGQLTLQTRTEKAEWRSVAADLSGLAQAGSRLCLGVGGSVLISSPPGGSIPVIFELQWRRCDGTVAACSGDAAWYVRAETIRQAPELTQVPEREIFPCVLSVRTNSNRDTGEVSGFVEVDFTAEASREQCDRSTPTGARGFRAAYVAGVAAPLLTRLQRELDFRPCRDIGAEGQEGEGERRCDLPTPAGGQPLTLVLKRRVGGWWAAFLDSPDKKVLLHDMPFFGPDIKRAAFDEEVGEVVMTDSTETGGGGLFYKVVATYDRLEAALRGRACYNKGYYPHAMEMYMNDQEKAAEGPTNSCPQ